MKILITNSVPLNGGDEALLRATYLSLKCVYPNADITVLCSNVELCKKYITDINLDSDIEFLRTDRSGFKEKFLFKIRKLSEALFRIDSNSKLSLLFANADERRVKKLYNTSNLIISSPGGFLHDHYPIEHRISGFKLAFKYHKPVIFFAQSIGPFWKKESLNLIRQEFKNVSAIILREDISFQYLKDYGLSSNNLFVTTDAAFLWRRLNPELFTEKFGKVKSIVMCFRNWPIVNNRIGQTIEKAVELSSFLLKDENITLTFLSTCQGIPGYVDDSVHAAVIISKLDEKLQKRCFIDSFRYSPVDLIKKYSEFDAFIGMRLHGAILSMLGGTPAMGLGYEDKTRGIFDALGFNDFQISYEMSAAEWIECATNFLDKIDFIRNQLPQNLDRVADVAMQTLELTKKVIEKA